MAGTDFDDWYKKSEEVGEQQNAYNTGLGYSRNFLTNILVPPQQTGCVSSSQCGSGFGCVNGKCVSIGDVGGNGSPNSPGNCPSGSIGNDCNSGSYACQSSPTCGSGSGVTECCGGDVTYVFKPGEESRVEGECVTNEYCHYYCSSRYALFGPPDGNPEFYDPCAGKSICENTDCEECGLFSGLCEPKSGDRPCWCNGGASCGECEGCITDPTDSNFGSCAPTDDSLDRCRQCVTLESYKCCGKDVGPLEVCSKPGFGGTTNDLRDELKRQAKEKCSALCDSCEQKDYKTYCSDTTGLPGSDLNCPDGKTCKQTGSMTSNGVTCIFVEEKDTSDCPWKPGRWEFTGTQSYHGGQEVLYRTVNAYFIQGNPEDPSAPYSGDSLRNCADGGCYPVMSGPGHGGGTQWQPVGVQEAWGESILVEAIESPGCTGDTFACGLSIMTSSGQGIDCRFFSRRCLSVNTTWCGCWRTSYYDDEGEWIGNLKHYGPGCSLTGKWTYVG